MLQPFLHLRKQNNRSISNLKQIDNQKVTAMMHPWLSIASEKDACAAHNHISNISISLGD
jgi:hypothetical protein